MSFDPSNIDVEDYLECLEIERIEIRGEEAYFSCPFPGHDNGDMNPSASMNLESTIFFCYGCKRRGNAINFAAGVLGITPLEAIRMLKERYQPGYINPDAISMVDELRKFFDRQNAVEIPVQPLLAEETLERFATDWNLASKNPGQFEPTDYILNRGFSPEALEYFEFGYDDISSRITFAIRDEHKHLIGFKGRSWRKEHIPKYLVIGDKPERPERYGWPCYYTGRVIYGADKIIPDTENIIMCEGELNVVSIWDKTRLPAVAINGSHFTQHHAKIMRKIAGSAILFMDSDKAGDAVIPSVVDLLSPYMPIKIVPPHEGDPAEMTSEQILDCISAAKSPLALALHNW